MTNKTKKITILTTALAGSLLATSIGAVALSACGTTTAPAPETPSTPIEDPNKEFEGTSFATKINWNDKEQVSKLIKDDNGLIFADDKKIEVIAIDLSTESTEITIPSSVRAITGYTDITDSTKPVKKGAFESNAKIKTVKFAGNTFTIGKQAFRNAKELKTIKLPKSLNIIDNNAFEGCSKLELFDLSNVKVIGNSAFKNAFPVATRTTKEGETTETPITSISLTKTITIGDNAFENANLKDIDFKGNTQLRSIGVAAFKDSKLTGKLDLRELTNLTEIENETFKGTSNLDDITLPESITVLGKSVFESTGATSIDLFSTQITTIPAKTFYNASKLENVKLKEQGIITFEDNSFQGTIALKELKLPNTLNKLGLNVFNADINLENNSIVEGSASGITEFNFSNTMVTQIPHLAFAGMKGLTKVTLKSTTKALGAYMLANSSVNTLDLGDNTTLNEIPQYAFNSATALEKLIIDRASGLTTFKSHSFQNTPKLTTLKVPASLETIEINTFNATPLDENTKQTNDQNNAASLTSLDLSGTTKPVGLPNNAFKGCTNLEEIRLHTDTETIPNYAFAKSGLQRLSFGPASSKDGQDAQNTPKKLDFTKGTKISDIGINAFEGAKFTEADFTGTDKLETINTGVFKDVADLTKVTLGTKLKSIHHDAFVGNSQLSNVNFVKLAELSNIQQNNFNGTAFTSLDLSKTQLTTISENIFKDLTGNITSVDLPVGITNVNSNSFTKKGGTDDAPSASLNIVYKDSDGNTTLPTALNDATDTSKLAALGFKNNDTVDLTSMSKLTKISGGTFSGATKLEQLTLPAKAVTFEITKVEDLNTAAFNNNNNLIGLTYENFELNSSNDDFTNQKLILTENDYPNKITNANSKILSTLVTLMNSVGRKDNLQNTDIMNDNTPKDWPSAVSDWFESDVNVDSLKNQNAWTEGSTDSGNTTAPDFTTGTKTTLSKDLTSANKQTKEVFFKHNNVIWKWTQKRIDANQVLITVETFDNNYPMFYKATGTNKNKIALFGQKNATLKDPITAKDIKITLTISDEQA